MPEPLALTIVCEPGEEGWVIASIPEVAGVFSQGRTREEARANVIDAPADAEECPACDAPLTHAVDAI